MTRDLIDQFPAAAKLGTASAIVTIALYLVYFITTGVASAAQVEAVLAAEDAHAARVDVLNSVHDRQIDVQTRLLRIMCAEIAKSEAVRLECARQ